MKKMLLLFLFLVSCAKSNEQTNPNAFYYYAYAKYLITFNDFGNWNGLFFIPGNKTFSFNFQSTDFQCRGLATYDTISTDYFPKTIGESTNISGQLKDPAPADSCLSPNINFDIKYMGLDVYGQDYYEMTLSAERYLIKTNK